MRSLPEKQLDARVRTVWRLVAATWVLLVLVAAFAPTLFLAHMEMAEPSWYGPAFAALALVLVALFVIALPGLRYRYWRYEVAENELYTTHGVIWRVRTVIPFVRVQNTDTTQGPILRMLGLASVTVSTAAGAHEIPGLALEEADALRDRIAEEARLAQEDL